jgi:hypothetical protein
MAQGQDHSEAPPALSDRIKEFCREIQRLITQGIEHPRFEFKRSCSISRENLDDRLDFIKLLQGVANAEIAGERCIVIGGDPKAKSFHPVANGAEFDHATVDSIVAKYLDPMPQFEVFNNLQTEDGHPFVLFVLAGDQPRPIVVTTEGKRTDGKTRLQIGDIWIKRGTALQLAMRDDLEQMYKVRMEQEAEDRARKRFKHFSDVAASMSSPAPSAPRAPAQELLFGPAAEFRRFVEDLFAANDQARFRMLLELIRESLVDGWDKLSIRGGAASPDMKDFTQQISAFNRDEFLPALQSLVTIGLLIAKYDFQLDWLRSVATTLVEAFEASRGLQRLKSHDYAQMPDALPWWRPGFDIYTAARCLAVYPVNRARPGFLAALLPLFVERLTIDDRRELNTPLLFWPLPTDIFVENELIEGRSSFYWKDRISSFWGSYFGTYEKFLGASCELEFVLELNSYLGTNMVKDSKIQDWLEANGETRSFIYNPDFYSYDLRWTVPMAEWCYDAIASDKPFPSYLAVDPALFELAFKGKTHDQRLLIYGGFLYHLKYWQAQAMMQFRRFPFMFDWQGRLLEISQKYKDQLPKT